MKITKRQLKQIIKEEIDRVLNESDYQRVHLDKSIQAEMIQYLLDQGVYKESLRRHAQVNGEWVKLDPPESYEPRMIDPFSGYTSAARKALEAAGKWDELDVSAMHTVLNNMID